MGYIYSNLSAYHVTCQSLGWINSRFLYNCTSQAIMIIHMVQTLSLTSYPTYSTGDNIDTTTVVLRACCIADSDSETTNTTSSCMSRAVLPIFLASLNCIRNVHHHVTKMIIIAWGYQHQDRLRLLSTIYNLILNLKNPNIYSTIHKPWSKLFACWISSSYVMIKLASCCWSCCCVVAGTYSFWELS